MAQLQASDSFPLTWPKGKESVFVHGVNTPVRSLYRSQVVIVRRSLDAPHSQGRYWASSDLQASPERLLLHSATRLRYRGAVRG